VSARIVIIIIIISVLTYLLFTYLRF